MLTGLILKKQTGQLNLKENAMTKARDLANIISAGSILSDGDIDPNEITGVTATAQEINLISGVSGNIQDQIDELSDENLLNLGVQDVYN